ncbi:sigma-54-dependent Fis family transcriptional regulator [bacterium]|nr:sigma-54-dependent Fis family transcriptional regulator [bacterium]
MADDPSVLLKIARVNESKADWAAALDCLERAFACGASPAEVAAVASRIEARAASAPLVERARAVALRAAAGERVSSRDLEAAREVLVTPDVVLALRRALGGREEKKGTGLALPVEAVLSRLLACDLDLAPVIALALDLVLDATGAPRGLLLVRDEKGRLELSAARGLERGDLPAEFSTSILAEAERTGEPVFVGDAKEDARFAERPSVKTLGLRSVACVPILEPGTGASLGVVYLDDPASGERFALSKDGASDGSIEERRDLLRSLARAVAVPLRNARRFDAQRRALASARAQLAAPPQGSQARLVGRSRPIKDLLEILARVAPEDVPVLIEGESGTGKELAARVLHDLSPRRSGPFVAENLASLPQTLVEAELFGVTKGAFTGADRDRDGVFVRAQGGTIFLDEIGELPPESQAKLLRVLQEREVRPLGAERPIKVDARVIAATNRDLPALAREGKFREDLLYRLRVVAIRVPALRERLEDIPIISEHILERIALERGEPVAPLSREALRKLVSRPWRGNVRELENLLWRVALRGEHVLDESVAAVRASGGRLGVDMKVPEDLPPLEEARQEFDRAYLSVVLGRMDGNVSRAARALGMTRPALSRLLKRLGIERV